MQGRLSPRPRDRLQIFPTGWQREFETATQMGFEFLEWLLLATPAGDNPLQREQGRREIRQVVANTGLQVASVCAARFITDPLAGLPETIAAAAEIGARRVVVPLLEQAQIRSPKREEEAVACLEGCVDAAERAGITLLLELDVPGEACARILRRLDHPSVRVCYDSGNATALGLNAAVDVAPVLDRLGEVHVKDRLVAGASVTLGSGDTDFARFFEALRRGGFDRDVVLEHFFDEDPVGEGSRALGFVRQHLRDAGF
jgi:L-ribulose-5-phosphate 3-epimerase